METIYVTKAEYMDAIRKMITIYKDRLSVAGGSYHTCPFCAMMRTVTMLNGHTEVDAKSTSNKCVNCPDRSTNPILGHSYLVGCLDWPSFKVGDQQSVSKIRLEVFTQLLFLLEKEPDGISINRMRVLQEQIHLKFIM